MRASPSAKKTTTHPTLGGKDLPDEPVFQSKPEHPEAEALTITVTLTGDVLAQLKTSQTNLQNQLGFLPTPEQVLIHLVAATPRPFVHPDNVRFGNPGWSGSNPGMAAGAMPFPLQPPLFQMGWPAPTQSPFHGSHPPQPMAVPPTLNRDR